MAVRVMVFLVFFNLSFAAEGACEQSARSDDERFTALSAVQQQFDHRESDFQQFDERFLERFRALWCGREYGEGLAQATDSVVSIRLRAARLVAFYARPDWILDRLRAVVKEAYARGLADSGELRNLITAYQAAGQYQTAREIRTQYPDAELPEVPQVVPPSNDAPQGVRLVWHVDSEANRLKGGWLAMDGPQLLVVTSPGCSFCKAAAEVLMTDDILGPLMRRHASWLAEPSMNNSFRSVAHWNEHHPEAPTMLVDDPDDWPIPQFEATPRFHFVRDGEIIHTLAGWQGGTEALQAIADGFGHLGLIDTSQLPEDVFVDAEEPTYTGGCAERDEAWELIRKAAPINTRDDLERHLAGIESGGDSPLTDFSTEGRKRFVSSMRFSDDGQLMGFSYGELKAQLKPAEIHEVTALFGHQYHYAGKLFDPEMLSEEERELKAMLDCRTDG